MTSQITSAFRGAFFMGNRMLKNFILALLFAGFMSPAHSAGTIPLSLSQQFDRLGKPLINCYLYIYQAGTTATPQNAYQDSALTIPTANPMRCDSAGRLSQFFLADGSIKVRLTDQNGVSQLTADGILVIGPSGGGGGGSSVDPTTILATGDIKVSYGTGSLSGFVRANGRTIGNATSGATERANADTSALFAYLYGADTNLAVSGGRGASAAADYAANKTIALPDWRGRALAGLDDMGNSAAGRLTASYFGTAATTLGAAGGTESRTIITSYLPPYTPSGSIVTSVPMKTLNGVTNGAFNVNNVSSGNDSGLNASAGSFTATSTFTGTAQGGTSTPMAVASPMMLTTIYLKL